MMEQQRRGMRTARGDSDGAPFRARGGPPVGEETISKNPRAGGPNLEKTPP